MPDQNIYFYVFFFLFYFIYYLKLEKGKIIYGFFLI